MEPSTTKIFNKILCPVDFDHSLDALDFAIKLARQNDAKLCVLNVAPIPIGAAELTSGLEQPFWEVTAKARLELIAKQKLVNTVEYELMTRSGDASAGILTAAVEEHIDLIAMSTHGRSGISHFFLGSVAERVVREASCPVLTIRPG
jgi:nucleotide-binding universal stress UspA family protein